MKIEHQKTLGRLEAMLNKIGGDDGLDLLLADKLVLIDPAKAKRGAKTPEPLFTFVGRFKTEGTKEFIAAKNYIINTSENARVRISYLGDNFRKHLLPVVERDIVAGDLILSKLGRSQHDLPMSDEEPGTIAWLGGLTKARVALYEFYETLAHKQAIGDLSWTVSYAHGVVFARWRGVGWFVGVSSVEDPRGWRAGDEFVSR